MCQTCAEFIDHIHGSDESKSEKLRAETELELARIRRDEAIQLAKITQKMNEDDNDAALVASETASEVQADFIDQMTETEPDVVIMETSEDADIDGEPLEEEFAEAPPEVEPESVHTPKSNWSYWS